MGASDSYPSVEFKPNETEKQRVFRANTEFIDKQVADLIKCRDETQIKGYAKSKPDKINKKWNKKYVP